MREEASGRAGQCGEGTPHHHTTTEHESSLARIGQMAEGNPDQCVEQHECRRQAAELSIAELPLDLDLLTDRTDHLTVVEIHEIEAEQDGEGVREPAFRERRGAGIRRAGHSLADSGNTQVQDSRAPRRMRAQRTAR